MTSVRGSKKSKSKTLRGLIDKRKEQKAADPAQPSEELDFSKTTFNDVASMDKESTKSVLAFFKEELLAGIRAGMNEELQNVDSDTKKRLDASGIVKELYEGIKHGINEELKHYIDASTTSLKDTMTNLVSKMEDAVNSVSAPPSVAPQAPIIGKKNMGGLSVNEQEKVSQQFLERENLKGSPTKSIPGRLRNYLEQATLGSIGLSKLADERQAKRESMAFTLQTERKLDPEKFKGMSDRKATKLIEKEQKQREKVKKKLSENEAEVSQLRRAGYSDADVEKLGYNKKRADLLQDAVRADPSRLGKEFDPKTAIGSDVKHAIGSEEDRNEAAIQAEKMLETQEAQQITLTEIRDILKQQNKPGLAGSAPLSNPQGEGETSGPSISIDVPNLPGKPNAPNTTKPKSTAGSKAVKAAKMLGKVAAIAGAGDAVFNGVSDLADGKKVESVSDIVPQGGLLDKINPFNYAMRGGMFVGDKINKFAESKLGPGGIGGWFHDKINGNTSDKLLGSSVTPPTTGNRLISKATADNVEAKQPIVVNAPPATVINKGGDQKVIMPPFINNMHNNEPSISRYIRSIY